jgi:hypothetical protein
VDQLAVKPLLISADQKLALFPGVSHLSRFSALPRESSSPDSLRLVKFDETLTAQESVPRNVGQLRYAIVDCISRSDLCAKVILF